jgi:hypothetical protein
MVEQAVLGRAQVDAFPLDDDLAALQIHLQPVVDGDDLIVGAALLLEAAQHRANTAGEFARAERLGDVVVGAQVKPLDAVVLVGAHREHDHRRVANFADAAQVSKPSIPGISTSSSTRSG